MEVQILCKKMIRPSSPTPCHLQTMKLSLIDQIIPPTHINMIFYYSSNGEKATERFSQLEQSLAEALTKYYPLAGRLVVNDLSVDCNDQGVQFVEAEVTGNLAEFLRSEREIEVVDKFVPWDHIGACGPAAGAPLAAVQISTFDCGGWVLGISVSHKVADLYSIIGFVNGWAAASRSGIQTVAAPVFELGSLFPTSNLLPLNPPPSMKKGTKIVTRRFFFGELAIQALVREAGGAAPTRVAAATALIWKALIGVAQAKHGHLRTSLLVHPMNLRGNTGLSIPENSFGNMPMLFITRFLPEERKKELSELVSLVGESRRDWDPAKITNLDDLCAMVSSSFGEARREKIQNERVDVHLCASWSGLPLYEADFGWGKPVWVSSTSTPYEVVSLIDNRSGDAIEAWVSLNQNDMLHFERDSDILAFTSQ
ncbi:acetyl-CoA-benzylalcohol acetyltransferase-like [Diospyros lotus]|uniref:acetyl-CoA-benzylalcohol acetyltransferase-like n=1 Tax=Diospyros lotus TaxID=55363 RepID=UPI00224DDB1F|nr:acetyl-CoA-benzylalcohol acetyltransferase-like [Diospyros lotus]